MGDTQNPPRLFLLRTENNSYKVIGPEDFENTPKSEEFEGSEKITFIDSDDVIRPGYIVKESGNLQELIKLKERMEARAAKKKSSQNSSPADGDETQMSASQMNLVSSLNVATLQRIQEQDLEDPTLGNVNNRVLQENSRNDINTPENPRASTSAESTSTGNGNNRLLRQKLTEVLDRMANPTTSAHASTPTGNVNGGNSLKRKANESRPITRSKTNSGPTNPRTAHDHEVVEEDGDETDPENVDQGNDGNGNEDEDYDDDRQLYGPVHPKGRKMELLTDNIYCIKRIKLAAENSARTIPAIARNLVIGVYTEEALLHGTVSGNPTGVKGKEKYWQEKENVVTLHRKAYNAIMEFTKVTAITNKKCESEKQYDEKFRDKVVIAISDEIGKCKANIRENGYLKKSILTGPKRN